jgi:hypothetical protein
MPRDYRGAAERHYADAETLAISKSFDNADQLNGFAAECALNAILVAAGLMPARGKPRNPFDKHVDGAWDQFHLNASGPVVATYVRLVPRQNPFADWRAEQRYAPTGFVTTGVHAAHRAGADAAMLAVRNARADGVVR